MCFTLHFSTFQVNLVITKSRVTGSLVQVRDDSEEQCSESSLATQTISASLLQTGHQHHLSDFQSGELSDMVSFRY